MIESHSLTSKFFICIHWQQVWKIWWNTNTTNCYRVRLSVGVWFLKNEHVENSSSTLCANFYCGAPIVGQPRFSSDRLGNSRSDYAALFVLRWRRDAFRVFIRFQRVVPVCAPFRWSDLFCSEFRRSLSIQVGLSKKPIYRALPFIRLGRVGFQFASFTARF